MIFEPFWAQNVPLCESFARRQYLRPGSQDQRFAVPADKIVRGAIRNPWADRFTPRGIYRARLIKDIRVNLFLYWLHHRYPAMPIVFLMRHPLAVVSSQRTMGWQLKCADLYEQIHLVEDFLEPFRGVVQECRDDFDRMIVLWCIENYVPLKQFSQDQLHLVFFEELVRDPEYRSRKIFEFLGRDYESDVMARINTPSELARASSAIRTGGDVIHSWHKTVSESEVKRAMEFLRLFGLDTIYGEESMPDSGQMFSMLRRNEAGP